jgi:hypothetical protein
MNMKFSDYAQPTQIAQNSSQWRSHVNHGGFVLWRIEHSEITLVYFRYGGSVQN